MPIAMKEEFDFSVVAGQGNVTAYGPRRLMGTAPDHAFVLVVVLEDRSQFPRDNDPNLGVAGLAAAAPVLVWVEQSVNGVAWALIPGTVGVIQPGCENGMRFWLTLNNVFFRVRVRGNNRGYARIEETNRPITTANV